ncbi:heterokaryon incompatibility protein-domain-containing protein [Chaetomium sp. MPI-CAGE-AT-0009]|nr:heterokaryon incompatibility protein-domain-containing protein [Chaetomium sp. MPI-CAGE-AT-0009]
MLKRIFSSHTRSDSAPVRTVQSVPVRPADVEAAVGPTTRLSVPTYPLAGTHRLHHIHNLCPACRRIDTRIIAVSERYTLLANFWDLEGSAVGCRFCALLVQALKDSDNQDIDTTLAALGLIRNVDACSLCLSLDAGILRAYVAPRSSKITDDGFTLAQFKVYLDEDAGLREEILAGHEFPPLLPPPPSAAPRLDTTWATTHFDHAECSIQDRAEIATIAVQSVLQCLPPCTCPGSPNDRTRDRYTDEEHHRSFGPATVRVEPRLPVPALPTRVIDMGASDMALGPELKLRLSLSSPHNPHFAHYATLSHRWGGGIPFMTTNSAFTSRVNGFYLHELPPSFQDAVLVARSLGLRYLWIDSLCIVQDDEADWLAQSQQMGRIFANSTMTIAAHSAQDSTQGFLGSFLVPDFLRISPDDPLGGFTIPTPELSSEALLRRFSQSCLSSRAWVMQELCLSPRILHFVENRVLWECQHTPLQIGGASPETWAALLSQRRRLRPSWENLGETRYDFWRELISQYSACQLTKAGDKLIAVAGIAEQLDGLFGSNLSYHYHCGIFNADVVRSILWHSSQAPKPLQKPGNRAPTWSWASVDGRLAFAASPNGTAVESCVVFRSISPTGVCPNTIEMAPWLRSSTLQPPPTSTCSLVIEGMVIERQHVIRPRESGSVALTPRNGPQVVGVWTSADPSSPTHEADIAWEIIDSEVEMGKVGKPSKIKCLVVSTMSLGGKFIGAWMLLLLKHTWSPKTYKRVGLGCLLDESILNMASQEVFTVV